jgi:hypothetical protein
MEKPLKAPWLGEDLLPLIAVVLPALLLLIIPSLFWGGSITGNPTNVGGDVPTTLFMDPGSFLTHLMSQKIGIGLTGTDTFLPYFSLAAIALFLNSVGLDSQLVVAGLVLALTYLGVYFLMTSILPRRALWLSRVSAAVGGSVAVLAPLTQTSFSDWEPRLYLYPLVPWLLYAMTNFVRTGRKRYLWAGVAMTIAGSAGITDIPGSLPAFVLIALLLVAFAPYYFTKQWISARRLLSFVAVIVASNAYWLLPFSIGLVAGQGQATFAASGSGKQAALSLVAALIPYQQLSNVLELRTSELLMKSFYWTALSFSSWYQRLAFIGYLPFTVVFTGFFATLFSRDSQKFRRVPILGLLIVSIVMLGFLSLTFPPGARQLFDFLTVHLPGWVAVKNFYGTLVIPYVLAVALATAAGFYVLASFVRRSVAISAALVLVVLLSIYGAPLFPGDSYNVAYYDDSSANRVVSALPVGYTALMSRIESSGGAPTLSLPLLEPGWTYLVGQESGGTSETYIGIPPLYFLDAVSNYTGVSSFGSSTSLDLQTNLQNSVLTGNAKAFARVTEMLGVRWVLSDLSVVHQADFHLVNAEPSAASALSFSYSVESALHAVVVTKVGIYSLLRVRSSDTSSVISIDENDNFSRSSDGIGRVASGKYRGPLRRNCPSLIGGASNHDKSEVTASITSHIAAGDCFVALRVPYSSQWSADLIENGRTISLQHRIEYGFANGFVLPALRRGSIRIVFSNSHTGIDDFSVVISIAVLVILAAGTFVDRACRRKRKEHELSDFPQGDES